MHREITAEPLDVPTHGIARNAAFDLVVRLTMSAFIAALTLFLVRALDPDGYGILSLAIAIGTLMALLAELGVSASAARFVAEHRGDREATARVVADAFKLKVVLTALVSVALLAAAGPISTAYDEEALVWPLRGIALAIFGQGLMVLFGGSFIAQGRTFMNLRIVVVGWGLELGTTITLVLLGAGAAGAAFGRATGYLAGGVLATYLTVRALGRSAIAIRGAGTRLREIVRYAGALALVDAAMALFDQLGALLIGAFLGATSVGLFQAPVRLTTFLLYPGYAIANGVAPRLARSKHQEPNREALHTATRLIVVFQAALLAPLLVWAGPIVELLFGSDYGESADVLRALTPAVFLLGLGPLVSLGANYLGLARSRVPIAVAAVVVSLAINLALIPTIGIVAGAIATSAALALYVPAHLVLCWRALALEFRPLLVTLLRSLVAAAAMGGVLVLIGTSLLGLGDWILGATGGTAAYMLVLLLTGEVTPAELRAGRAFVATRLGRKPLAVEREVHEP